MFPLWLRNIPSGWETCRHICASSHARPANFEALAGRHMMRCFAGIRKAPNVINASFYQVYVAKQQETVAVPCKHCQEVDHSDAECAVAEILPKPLPLPARPLPLQRPDRPSKGKGKHPTPYSQQWHICNSWNARSCKSAYDHVSAHCYGPHPALACRDCTLPCPPIPQSETLVVGLTARQHDLVA